MVEAEPSKPSKRGPKPGFRKGEPRLGGTPKGYKFPETIRKEEAKAILREMVVAELRPIVRAQIKSAVGVDHMMLRDPETGMFRRLTELAEIEQALNAPNAAEGSTFWIHTKDPNIQAAADLLNRAIGKPVEEISAEVTVNAPLAEKIKKARQRAGV